MWNWTQYFLPNLNVNINVLNWETKLTQPKSDNFGPTLCYWYIKLTDQTTKRYYYSVYSQLDYILSPQSPYSKVTVRR